MTNKKILFFLNIFLFCILINANAETCKCGIEDKDGESAHLHFLSSQNESTLSENNTKLDDESIELSNTNESKVTQTNKSNNIITQIFEGEVIEVDDGKVTFRTTTGKTFLLIPSSDGFKIPEVGWLLRIQIIFSGNIKGDIQLAKMGKLGYKRINNYSPKYGGSD